MVTERKREIKRQRKRKKNSANAPHKDDSGCNLWESQPLKNLNQWWFFKQRENNKKQSEWKVTKCFCNNRLLHFHRELLISIFHRTTVTELFWKSRKKGEKGVRALKRPATQGTGDTRHFHIKIQIVMNATRFTMLILMRISYMI